ncbi:MAG: choice-of-anchor D domain-containing protein [Myxococcales bacterium]|nr:choice-of-anchor D domain-containing protein [Myxococcales bacterium]
MSRHLPLLALLCIALSPAFGCSDSPEGSNGDKGGGGNNNGGCTGQFCVEVDIQIGADPQKLVFLDIPVGETATRKLRISHVGSSGVLNVDNVKFEPATDEFKVLDFKPAQLSTQESFEVTVSYTPLKAGGKKLNVVFANNDNDTADKQFNVPIEVKAGAGSLKVSPDPIDFGPVASNTCEDLVAKIFNSGQKPIRVTAASLSGSGSPDFKIKSAPDAKTEIAPLASVDITLTFCPKPGDDNDTTELALEDSDGGLTIIAVYGAEIAPRLSVVPPVLNYGSMKLKAKATRSFKIFNEGIADLNVSKIEVSVLSKVKTLKLSDKGPFTLKAKENKLIDVELEASVVLPNDGSAVASLVIHSNDQNKKQINIPVFAKTETGSLKVTPDKLVDFAIVGKGLAVTRKVELFNQGTAAIEIKEIKITDDSNGEYELVTSSTFPPLAANPGPHTMKAAEYQSFKVKFTATGTVGAKAKGKLLIKSTDPDTPDRILTLVADRAEGSKCNVKIIPGLMNFGILTYGQSKTLAVTVKNVGTGYCSFADQRILDCKSGLLGGAPVCALIGVPQFTTFAPSTKLFNLAPGDSGKLNILFNAPNDGGLFANPKALLKYFAFLAVKFKDQATGLADWYPKDPAKNTSKLTPNLQASVGEASVNVLPGSIDFGLVTVGCKSKVEHVSVFNTGITPVFITKIEFQGCGLEMAKKSWPGIPKKGLEVSQSTPVNFGVQYAPQNVGKDSCQMVVITGNEGQCVDATGTPTASGTCKVTGDCKGSSDVLCSGQSFSVPLKGEGTLLNEFTDEFEQGAGKKVDVLFVIDNSGSMGDEQKNLAANFGNFIKFATLWQNDYHIGVVTTDMKNGNDKGRLRTHNGTRIVTTKTSNPTGTFQDLAKVGTNGSATEQGLAAAKAALTLPHIFDSGKSCKVDSDCSAGKCVKGPDGKLGCGGHNRGFLRKQAGLEIVFVSDEEDSSASDLKYYVNFLYSIKGAANKGLFHAHAIVGLTASSGSGGGGCGAGKGSRYITVAKDTGGKTASICDKSFATTLKNIGEAAFGLTQQFFLTMNAEPSTIKVWINGKECVGGKTTWSHDSASNSVTFIAEPTGTCMPKKGDKVKIYYKTLCFP